MMLMIMMTMMMIIMMMVNKFHLFNSPAPRPKQVRKQFSKATWLSDWQAT